MELVKKNMLSIICGAVVIVAIVVWLVPVRGMLASQQAELESHKQQYDELEKLARKPHNEPSVDLPRAGSAAPAENKTLAGFPNTALVEQGAQVMQKVRDGSQ